MPKPIRCIICGCHQSLACTHPDAGPCSWDSIDPPVCSHCADPEMLRDADRHKDNLLHTSKLTIPLIRKYFKALEMSVSVFIVSRRKINHWQIQLTSPDKEKTELFDELIPALFHEAKPLRSQYWEVNPELYCIYVVKEYIRKGGSNA